MVSRGDSSVRSALILVTILVICSQRDVIRVPNVNELHHVIPPECKGIQKVAVPTTRWRISHALGVIYPVCSPVAEKVCGVADKHSFF